MKCISTPPLGGKPHRLIYLSSGASSHDLARALYRELGELRFAHLRRAMGSIDNTKPCIIEHPRQKAEAEFAQHWRRP